MMRVLVVEDIDSMRYLLQYTLEKIPDVVVSGLAANCWEARQELLRERPDVVLLDEILPGESAVDFLKECVQEHELKVILMTGIEKPEHAVPEGALGRMVKPLGRSLQSDVHQLQKDLKRFLKA